MDLMLNVVPFFLAARVVVDVPRGYWPEYTFLVQVNSTAIVDDSYPSVRLNIASKLVCQPKNYNVLTCHFRDSEADSFVADSHDPGEPGVPVSPVYRQKAYEIYQDQFEMRFTTQGLEGLVVNENIQPRELDMIRVIVGQLNIGPAVAGYDDTFELMENFTQGECVTIFYVNRDVVRHGLPSTRDYVLETMYGLREDQFMQIRKIRNLHMCTHKVPYYFGSADTTRGNSDLVTTVNSSESHIVITSTEFISGTANVIRIGGVSQGVTLFENINLRLKSIVLSREQAPAVKDPEQASMFIGRWLLEDSQDYSMGP